jgi:small-conductance mechanosensitive channel
MATGPRGASLRLRREYFGQEEAAGRIDGPAARRSLDAMWRLVLFLLLVCPAAAQEAPAPPEDDGQPTGAIAVDQDVGADARIERRIRAILAELDGFDEVGVIVSEGIVTLTGEVLDAERVERLDRIAGRVEGVVAIENEVTESTDVTERLDPVRERFEARLAQAVAFLPLLAVALAAGLLVAVAGWGLAKLRWPWDRIAPNAFIAEIIRTVVRLVFAVMAVVLALDILGATALLGTLLGAAGIVGLAVGFAVRDTVENFIASVMLSLRQPFQPNDLVLIEGDLGNVVRLTSRATILLDPDGNHIRIPNATVFNSKIINYTRNAHRRFGFILGVDPADDLAEAKRIGLETLRGLPFVLDDPAPMVWVEDAGDSTVLIQFFGWVDQREAAWPVARGEALRVVMKALDAAGIGLPEPTYRLNIAGGGLPVVDLPDREGRPREMVATEGEPSAPSPRAEPVADVRPDGAVDRMVHAERRTEAGGDLLRHDGPEE